MKELKDMLEGAKVKIIESSPKQIYADGVYHLIQELEGTGYVEFQKVDGTLRKMSFTKIPSKVTGGQPLTTAFTNVIDVDIDQIRRITHDRVKRLEINGKKYMVISNVEL